MYGFYEDNLEGLESSDPYFIQVGYIKGSGMSFTATLQQLLGATASNVIMYMNYNNACMHAVHGTRVSCKLMFSMPMFSVILYNVTSLKVHAE